MQLRKSVSKRQGINSSVAALQLMGRGRYKKKTKKLSWVGEKEVKAPQLLDMLLQSQKPIRGFESGMERKQSINCHIVRGNETDLDLTHHYCCCRGRYLVF